MSVVERVLARPLRLAPIPVFPSGFTILITGAEGSIGREVQRILADQPVKVWATDIDDCDVTDTDQVAWWTHRTHCDVVLHLAGAKHAPAGEEDPSDPLLVNAVGTLNIVEAAYNAGATVVTASTCKSCDPETAYGASKLVAERITLNHGGVVARFHNVVETQGNVFDIWNATPEGEPIIVVEDCERYFIALEEAARLAIWCTRRTGGRYSVDPGMRRSMLQIADAVHPDRLQVLTRPRRGDRIAEPLKAVCETWSMGHGIPSGIARIYGAHDQHTQGGEAS